MELEKNEMKTQMERRKNEMKTRYCEWSEI